MRRIFICEDEDSIRELLVLTLTRAGYQVTSASSGTMALSMLYEADFSFELVLLDIMMPGIDGLTVSRIVREKNENAGIVFLTAKTQEKDKIEGFLSGADDYITKPFSINELIARIEAVCRRVELTDKIKTGSDEIVRGDFTLSTKKRAVIHNGRQIDLSQIEFRILEMLFSNSGRAINRDEILQSVWGDNFYGDDKVVDVNIRRLRIKVEDNPSSPEHLLTVRGKGYKWVE